MLCEFLIKYMQCTDCPEMKQLREVMRIKNIKITTSWHDLGVELLGSDDDLAVIEADHSSDVDTCCRLMFKKWLDRTPDASWSQLVTALREIKLYTAADVVSEHCKSGNYFPIYIYIRMSYYQFTNWPV